MTTATAVKVDKFLEAKLNKKLQASQKIANKQKALRAVQVAAEEIETVDSADEDDDFGSKSYSGMLIYRNRRILEYENDKFFCYFLNLP